MTNYQELGARPEPVAAVARIDAVPRILDLVCQVTGMGFAAVARVTEDRWIACSVKDDIAFGLEPGGELKVETTICQTVRSWREPVVIDHVAEDEVWRDHPTPAMYGFQSYISMPIILPDGSFFGTLCAIDPKPAKLRDPKVMGLFTLLAELIAFHLDSVDRVARTQAALLGEREAAALREQFIAVLGHDLRNPMAAIEGGVQMLAREKLSAKGADVLGLIRKSAARMSGLIDDVLDFARGRLGDGIVLRWRRPASMDALIGQVIAELQAAHPERTIEAKFELSGPVSCDPSRLGQLFSNLIANALTHGAADAPVKVRAAAVGGSFEFSVSNGGEPIPPDAMERLFQPFARGEVRPSAAGLGLGLYIAAEIARAHGGTLTASSTPEETRFTFRLPAEAA